MTDGYAPDPASAPPLRWGVLGPGWISEKFVDNVTRFTASEVVAVGSRSADRAAAFAAERGIRSAHGSYQELVDDPEVQAVYVASPHSAHHEHALLAIAAGKHVLVEKAFMVNAAQAEEVFDAARDAGVFAMEAMWTRHLPHVAALRAAIARGDIGEVVSVTADHGQNMKRHPPTHRLHAAALAGGALLDLGVYPVSFAHDMLGAPDRVQATGSLTPTGVDGQISIALGFGDRAQASLHTTLWAKTATTAVIAGTEGRIEVEGDFYSTTSFTVQRDDGTWWAWDRPVEGGFQYEVAEVARRVAAGELESPRMSWQGTLDVMRTMDEIRRQIGVRYPFE
ncbi:Gfo/Idh/MocA family oxidoreductase [Actinotalea sp. M2MS4P-6]|uniref:Gfo/Idh/MocA family protein n=1 Tax=Actinotalea sp. M2MS4P-6 TaxID=2983762 RepID=UPI0021E3D719|nr:Gfo/Idh/MocA family oxidoreductase [Actinotalea sp. M2MS4P-6]MCV2394926.1 Gfo/Idh/MocA family oxidoreductase [Actinotalea sp. M2MS4P-6]